MFLHYGLYQHHMEHSQLKNNFTDLIKNKIDQLYLGFLNTPPKYGIYNFKTKQ